MLLRHDATGFGWEGGGGGSPESEDLTLVEPVPLAEGGNVLHRPLVLLGVITAALVLVGPALALRVHVRVEGANATIFGPVEPRLKVTTGTITPPDGPAVTVAAATPLGALERASLLGEFYYRIRETGFGPYVDRIGRRAEGGANGWVYKVNGVSPPVGADQYPLKEGDRVLWYYATFGPAGGPGTLRLLGRGVTRCTTPGTCRRTLLCATAVIEDDNGKRSRARRATFRVDRRIVPSRNGEVCPRGHWHTVSATLSGAVRSQVLINPGGRRAA
jgi:hypothetical protein